jgi:hypothetical protein
LIALVVAGAALREARSLSAGIADLQATKGQLATDIDKAKHDLAAATARNTEAEQKAAQTEANVAQAEANARAHRRSRAQGRTNRGDRTDTNCCGGE